MVQFKCPRVMHPLLLYTFGVHYGVPFSVDAGKGSTAYGLWIKLKSILKTWASWTANGPIWMAQGHTPLGVIHFWGPLWGALFSACRKREVLHVACLKSGNSYCKNRFCGLQMVQLECPRVINPLVSSTFGVHCGVPFSLYAGKGKCCIWLF